MTRLLEGWQTRTASSPALRFIDACLRGVGQVMFQNHPLSGLLFLVAIAWGSYAARAPEIAIAGVVALVTGTATAYWLRADSKDIHAGLFGFNAYLVGLAVATFLVPSTGMWGYVVLGGGVSTVAMLAIARVCKTWEAPALTAPFVLVAWLLLLATHAFAGAAGALPASASIVPLEAAAADPLRIGAFFEGVLKSISQVFLKGSGLAAVLLVAGLAVGSLRAAAWAVAGAAIAVVTAHGLGAESELVTGGLMGFSPVLTAVALGAAFHGPGLRAAAYAVLGTIFTVLVQGALNAVVTPFAMPTLTAPFVLVTWLFLLARPRLA